MSHFPPSMISLEFTLTVSKCLSCAYCPQKKLGDAYHGERVMPRETFDRILNALPKNCAVHFSGFSEVFLHRHAAEMMVAASSLGYEVHLYTTLMGLSERQATHLAKARLAYIRLHLPDAIGLKVRHEIWLRQFNLFRATGHSFTAMAMGPVAPELKTILARHGVEIELPDMLSRGGNLSILRPREDITGRAMRCVPNRWHQNVVLPNGDVVGDCMDYGLTVPLGNLLTQPYCDIYAAAEAWRKNMETSAAGICANCEWANAA